MAYQENIQQRFYSQTGSSESPSHAQTQYSSVPQLAAQPNQPALRRTPSYQSGDDASYFHETPGSGGSHNQTGRSGGQSAYGGGGSQSTHGSRHSQFSVGSSQHSVMSQNSSHGSAMSGYQHQYQPTSSLSPNQSSYNPQQFATQPSPPSSSQSRYNPQAFSATSMTQYGSYPYQQYNPAAYQSPTSSYQPSQPSPNFQWQTPQTPNPYGQSSQLQYQPSQSHSQNNPRPMPMRSHDSPYTYPSPQTSNPPAHPSLGYSPSVSQHLVTSPVSTVSHKYSTLPPLPSTVSSTSSNSSNATYPRTFQQPHHLPNPPPHATSPNDSGPRPPAYRPQNEEPPYRNRPLSLSVSSQLPSMTPAPLPPLHQAQPTSPRRADTQNRHPQARPLPGPPIDSEIFHPSRPGAYNARFENEISYEDTMKEVEAAIMEGRPTNTRRNSSRAKHSIQQQASIQEGDETSRTSPGCLRVSPDFTHSHTNGHEDISATGTGQYVNYTAYSDDSEAEAAAGLAALQMAEEEEAALRARRNTHSSTIAPYSSQHNYRLSPTDAVGSSSDGDYRRHDMDLYGGSHNAQMQYGETFVADSTVNQSALRSSSHRSSNRSTEDSANVSDYEYPNFDDDSIHPFPSLAPIARVDTFGTGGLSEPSLNTRRLSFDDGDEVTLSGRAVQSNSFGATPEEGEPQDLFFHPGMTGRPLPPPPVNTNLAPHLIPAGTYRTHDHAHPDPYGQYPEGYYPVAPGDVLQSNAGSTVPRSTSFTGHTATPRTDPIIRSKTDADKVKLKQAYDASVSSPSAPIDLPAIPAGKRKKFSPSKLSTEQFRRCTEPWALSAIAAWVRDLSEDETDLKEQAIVDAIVALFTHKVPTMNTADAETLGARVVKGMLDAGALIEDEEWVKFGSGTISGVLWQITGQGCYSSRLHVVETEVFGRCYSHHCMRTLKKINLHSHVMEPQKKLEDWATFYKIGKDVFETHSKKDIELQNNLHEIVTTEDSFISQLDVLRTLYRDHLAASDTIHPKRRDRFLRDVFGKVDAVKRVNENYLLAQLKYRQKEQGPFIVGFSDIFREWIRKAKAAYIDYAATFPNANYLFRREAETNLLFQQFLKQARENKLSNRLNWDTYLKSPITRIQRYTLLLSTVHKNMAKDCEEKTNLWQAIEEIRLVAMDCDNKVGEMTKKVDLRELGAKLQLRPEMRHLVELNLEHLGREIIYQGDLQRPRTKRFNWVDTRAILFDHYLVLAKIVTNRDVTKSVKYETYDVSKLPIPMDLLILESSDDDPVMKSAVKGITVIAAPQKSGSGPGMLSHASTSSSTSSGISVNSGKTIVSNTVIDQPKDDKILYPFKIRHLGRPEVFVLYANTAKNRREWCEKIREAKTKHAASLYAQNAEPFRLRVLSDSAFAYSEMAVAPKSVAIHGTPLDRAIQEVEAKYAGNLSRPLPVCRASVNCATVFRLPSDRKMCAVGTDYGVYISEYNNPRGWTKVIGMMRITQIAVFEEFNLFLLIADKSLIAYHLDAICVEKGAAPPNDSQRRAPQKLSGNREVGFFAAGRMKDRALVFYKKRDGISSTFKVLEPVIQKTSSTKSRFLRRGNTDFFREYDEFYIPADSYSINLFHTSLAISTARGVEVLTLDKKQPWSVPNLRSDQAEAQAHLTRISNRIKDLRPLGMFRLSESEFLVAFEECAVYVNKHGDVSRSVVMEFVGRAHSACLNGKFLILFHDDFVEIRNAMNGRLRQVIAGKNVSLLDDGGNCSNAVGGSAQSALSSIAGNFNDAASIATLSGGMNGLGLSTGFSTVPRTVKICMQHPAYERSQIVVELIENEGQKD
ncbi:Rho guanine nucleotide exchange factor [Ophidiomyces ophidiicola]|nr:Rho guanine nucleotide exchange factor [Ophidiomyces ophidiicola]KAI1983082.1 Rho guanine nucleotide exchange factor [Ophidiomyces ophidiicola]KAI1987761.1 Rho guanine nucleotide exchange factor [Ophidiomyces ophidiicola]KAI2001161.1 Rho guanine nucleotide exchange factor [Ophidiomyces ophidiicola]